MVVDDVCNIAYACDRDTQDYMESVLRDLILNVYDEFNTNGIDVVCSKSKGDEQINLDVLANELIHNKFQKYSILSEESDDGCFKGKSINSFIATDPIDGSSESNRKQSLDGLTSSILLVENNFVIAAACADISSKRIYGIDEFGLYFIESDSNDKIYLKIDEKMNNSDIYMASYAPSKKRSNLLSYVSKLLADEKISYFHNNGGGMFSFNVINNKDKSYNACAELLPKQLYEHITEIMAIKAGCYFGKVDGSSLELDPSIKQTSILTRTKCMYEYLCNIFSDYYFDNKIKHKIRI
jgi:fructose-1,6-bisphosphatase/inositol monophosphatase family enzyme